MLLIRLYSTEPSYLFFALFVALDVAALFVASCANFLALHRSLPFPRRSVAQRLCSPHCSLVVQHCRPQSHAEWIFSNSFRKVIWVNKCFLNFFLNVFVYTWIVHWNKLTSGFYCLLQTTTTTKGTIKWLICEEAGPNDSWWITYDIMILWRDLNPSSWYR